MVKGMAGLKRRLNGSEQGVATTVGTIMALLIFLSILSLITQQYVPVWMEDNEAYHMDEVKGQFSDLKSGIDSMVINEQTDYPLYSSVNLGTAGIPLFAGSSPGRLTFSPRWGRDQDRGMSLSFTDDGESISFHSTGNISYHAINREFEDQSLIYEHGAIILEQTDGSIIRARPQISIVNVSDEMTSEYEVSITMIHLTGSSRDVAGTSRVGVTTELTSVFSNTFDNLDPDEPVYLNLTTAYADLWFEYFDNETDANPGLNANTVELELTNVTELTLTRVGVEVEVGR